MSKQAISKDPLQAQLYERSQKEAVKTVWQRLKEQEPHCGFGTLGICCKNCNLGPCRIDPFKQGAQQGVCGANADTICARNLLRHIAAGSACHSDHGREIAQALLIASEGSSDYKINNSEKLFKLADEFNVNTKDLSVNQVAKELAVKLLSEFGRQDGELKFIQRAPQKQKEIWKRLNIIPRGIDREVVEAMSRTHIGVDNEYTNIINHGMRTALADGWGGSMIGTEVSDILFGKPLPKRAKANLSVLKDDEVNIIVHGHVPLLSEIICQAAQDKEMLSLAKEKGANGINLAGMCCTANEILVRKGFPVAGDFLQQELALMTGAVELMVVDLQCIMPSLPEISGCFHTKLVSTSNKARFPGMEHIAFDEREALSIAKRIVRMAVENFPNRNKEKVFIPKQGAKDLIAGFTTEYVFEMLGGSFRPSFRPLNDAIIMGRIRGVAGVVGCDNPKQESSESHVTLVKELIKNDVLVVQTGCSALACARAGLLTPEAAFEYAGKGLKEVCQAVGCPPVLHLGSCVDNSRILTACCEMVKEGGIGKGLDELPVAGAAPEWMSEKAIAIGWYFVASGLLVVLGTPLPVYGSEKMSDLVLKDVEKLTGGKWAFEQDPLKMAKTMIDHIDSKRAALSLKPMMY